MFSPLKELKSSKKPRQAWSAEEDTALVQFIALHKDQQSTDAEWPAMKAPNIYWSDAAKYINQTAGTKHLREGTFFLQTTIILLMAYVSLIDVEFFYRLKWIQNNLVTYSVTIVDI